MLWIFLGSSFAFLGVAAGAFGAHALKNSLSEYHFAIFQTAVQYQLYHALALVLLGVFQDRTKTTTNKAGWSFTLGILLFSGSLYALSLTQIKWLGAITPFGGLLFLLGWLIFAISSFKNKTSDR